MSRTQMTGKAEAAPGKVAQACDQPDKRGGRWEPEGGHGGKALHAGPAGWL